MLKILKETDSRYKLYLAGKRPEEFANTWNIPEQKQYYLDTYQKIKDLGLEDSVIYTGWIKTSDFLKKIGYVLSLSDRTFPESFHVAPFEGMASGGVGLALDWEGIEYVYPKDVTEKSPSDIAERIISLNQNDEEYEALSQNSKQFVKENYDLPIIWESILNVID